MTGRDGEFARLLRRHRGEAGLTQRELATRAGLGERTVSDLERGVAAAPYEDTIRRLAAALELGATATTGLRAAARSGPAAASSVVRQLLDRSSTPELVGREPELERLHARLHRAEGGEGALVLVGGEAGVGKTRLALEGCRLAVERGGQVAIGRCYAAQRGVPFSPFVEALTALFAATPAPQRASVAQRWPHLTRLLPDVTDAGPVVTDDTVEAARLFRAVTGFVGLATAETPLVLVLEDLHDADQASLDLLVHLARHTGGDRLLVIGTYRSVGRAHPLRAALRELDREPTTARLGLDNLSEAGTAALVRACWAGDPPPDLASRLHERTDGNPFFLVETVADLRERASVAPDELPPPVTVSEAILGRVARLEPATRELLEVAAVLGPGELVDLLAVVGPDRDADVALDLAEDAGVLRTAGEQFAFDHALTQEALYAHLAVARRRRLHRLIGTALAARDGARARPAGTIARHLRLGGAPEQAFPYSVSAGEQAESVFAYREAEQHFRQALAEGDDPAAAAAVEERLGVVLAAQARFDEAYAALERSVSGHRAAGNPTGVDRAEAAVAEVSFRAGTPVQGIARLTNHLAAVPGDAVAANERRPGIVALHLGLARLAYADGRYAACRDAAEQGARLCRAADAPRLLADIELWRGIGLLWSDAPDGGVTALTHALALAESRGLLDVAGVACLPLHLAYALRGEFARGSRYADRGIVAAERTGDLALLAMHTANRAMEYVYRGDATGAAAGLHQAVELASDLDSSYFAPLPAAYLGVQHLAQGRLDEAEARLGEAAVRAREVGNREVLGYARTQLLRLTLHRGDAAAVVEQLGPDPDLTGVTWWYDVILLTVLAEALLVLGRAGEAAAVADRGVERARRMRNRVDGAAALEVQRRIRNALDRATT